MSTRTIVSAEQTRAAKWNQQEVERFTNDEQRASGHGSGRNERVATLLSYLSLLRSIKLVGPSTVVTEGGATRQHFNSPNGYQAAHYLPCQIYLSGRLPWQLVTHESTHLSITSLFGDVEHLPSNFNKADSIAESLGLKGAFQSACRFVLMDNSPTRSGKIDREKIRSSYHHYWLPHAERAFQAAILQKESRPRVPPIQKGAAGIIHYGDILNLSEREDAPDSAWNIEDQLRILQSYSRTLSIPPRSLLDSKMDELERTFQK